MASSNPDVRCPPFEIERGFDAILAFLIFALGGFAIAVATFVSFWVARVLWYRPPGMSLSKVFVIGVFATVYGFNFCLAFLSSALVVAAVVVAFVVWRFRHVSAGCLAGLLAACPVIVLAQVSLFGVRYDFIIETEADAFTATDVLTRFSPLLVPALAGAWFAVRQRQRRGRHPAADPASAP